MKGKLPKSYRIEWDGQVMFTWCPETARGYRRRGARVSRHEPLVNRERQQEKAWQESTKGFLDVR